MGNCKYCGNYMKSGYGYCSPKCRDDEARAKREKEQEDKEKREEAILADEERERRKEEYKRTTSLNAKRCLNLSVFCFFIIMPIAAASRTWWMLLFPLLSIVLGHSGLRQIKQSDTPLKGKASAIIGLFFSYLVFAAILLFVFKSK